MGETRSNFPHASRVSRRPSSPFAPSGDAARCCARLREAASPPARTPGRCGPTHPLDVHATPCRCAPRGRDGLPDAPYGCALDTLRARKRRRDGRLHASFGCARDTLRVRTAGARRPARRTLRMCARHPAGPQAEARRPPSWASRRNTGTVPGRCAVRRRCREAHVGRCPRGPPGPRTKSRGGCGSVLVHFQGFPAGRCAMLRDPAGVLRDQHFVGHRPFRCEAGAKRLQPGPAHGGVTGEVSPGVPKAKIVVHMPLDAPSAAAGMSRHEWPQTPSLRRSTYPGPSLPMAR
jgi:hypothetical protein